MADKKISALTAASTPLAGTEVLPIVQSSATVKVSVANLTAGRSVSATAYSATSGGFTSSSGGVHRSDSAAESNSISNLFYAQNAAGTKALNWQLSSTNVGSVWAYNGSSWIEVWAADTSGNLRVPTQNVIMGTAAKGVNFTANTPAAGMTSQLLNWYEEGTFTAGLTCGSGSVTLKSTNNTCAYTRIGRQVTVTGYLEVDSVSSPSGTLLLTGLPFTIRNANSAYPTGSPFLNLTGAITGTPVMLGYTNTTTVSFRRMSGGSAVDDMANLFGAGSQIIFTFVYIV